MPNSTMVTTKKKNGKEIFQNAIAYSGSVACGITFEKEKRILLIDNDLKCLHDKLDLKVEWL